MSDERVWRYWRDDEEERPREPGGGTTVLDRPGIDERTDDGSGTGISGWFCVKVKPFVCGGCGRNVRFHDEGTHHRIIVWPTENDPNMVRVVETLVEDDTDPKVVEYEKALGAAVSYYELTPS